MKSVKYNFLKPAETPVPWQKNAGVFLAQYRGYISCKEENFGSPFKNC